MRIKQIIFSTIVIPPFLYVSLLVSNLLLAFSQEAGRVLKLYLDTRDIAVFKTFSQSITSITNYQTEYQLYYIFVGVVVFYGVVKVVHHIFTDKFKPKRKPSYEVLKSRTGAAADTEIRSKVDKILVAVTEPQRAEEQGEGNNKRSTRKPTPITKASIPKKVEPVNEQDADDYTGDIFQVKSRSNDDAIMGAINKVAVEDVEPIAMFVFGDVDKGREVERIIDSITTEDAGETVPRERN